MISIIAKMGDYRISSDRKLGVLPSSCGNETARLRYTNPHLEVTENRSTIAALRV